MTEVLEMEKRKLNDEVNRLLRDLLFQKLAMELAEIINGSWDLDGIWGMLQPWELGESIKNQFLIYFLMIF